MEDDKTIQPLRTQHYPMPPLKYVMNRDEITFYFHEDEMENPPEYLDVLRGGEGNAKRGKRSRQSERGDVFLQHIEEKCRDLTNTYQKAIAEELGTRVFGLYKDSIVHYINAKERVNQVFPPEILKSIYDFYYDSCKFSKYTTFDITPCIHAKPLLSPDGMRALLEINKDYFGMLYDDLDDNRHVFLHRGLAKLMKAKTYKPSKLITSFTFSISTAEAFTDNTNKSQSSLVAILADEASDLVFGLPFLLTDLPSVHYESYEVLLLPPRLETRIYHDLVFDEINEFMMIERNSPFENEFIDHMKAASNKVSVNLDDYVD